MEAFSLLKYWRAAGGGGGVFAARDTTTSSSLSPSTVTTVLTAVTPSSSSSDDDSGNDDGPFFDLEFTIPDDDEDDGSSESEDEPGSPENIVGDVDESNETEIKLTVSSSSVGGGGAAVIPEETAPKFPVASILKSASKFRVQMRKFNKPKSDSRQKEKVEDGRHRLQGEGKSGSKLLMVKLKVEEAVPLVSVLFSKDHSNSSNKSSENSKANAKTSRAGLAEDGEEERKFAKELMNKYLKKVKPLYVRASKRYGDKLCLSPAAPEDTEKRTAPVPEKATEEAPPAGPVNKSHKQGNIQAGLRVVCKHLGKSRSASASAPPSSATAGPETSSSRRRDDSLLQQQDGIQSAIMHCKRSFNASRDSGTSVLSRSVR